MNKDLERQIKLCKMLGLDPGVTTNIWVSWEAGTLPTVSWEGRMVLSEEQSQKLGEILTS